MQQQMTPTQTEQGIKQLSLNTAVKGINWTAAQLPTKAVCPAMKTSIPIRARGLAVKANPAVVALSMCPEPKSRMTMARTAAWAMLRSCKGRRMSVTSETSPKIQFDSLCRALQHSSLTSSCTLTPSIQSHLKCLRGTPLLQ